MASPSGQISVQRPWFQDKVLLGMRPADYLKSLLRPADLTIALILLVGYAIIVYRFVYGLGAATNLSQTTPWGLWIGFDMLSGVALAAGGYTIATTVHVFGMEEYHPIVRPALLTGFLGYLFAVIGLIADLGRPWNLWVPMVGSYGTTSVMFEVAWCVAIYTTVLFLEFSPSLLEWLGLNKFRAMILKATLGLTILGMVLSTLHQSSLGALFLMAPTKLHPLWYSTYIPVFFFISSMCAGIGMVMVESGLAHHAFRHRIDPAAHVDLDGLTLGLAKAGAVVLFAYFFLKLQGVADGGRWDLLATPYGLWYLVEVVGFVLLPSLLLAYGARNGKATFVRWVAAWVVLGVVINRLNVSIIAMNWESADRYVPAVMEILTSLAIITTGVMVYRWIVNRMPVLAELPEYRGTSH